jgi:hypothetical protein
MNFSEQAQEKTQMYKDRISSDEADLEEYRIEIQRLRQIGLTIDPATAETAFFWADMNDPYDILGERYHEGQVEREYFARNPGGEWVLFEDLTEATRNLLWQRDGRRLVFPFGLKPGDDIMNSIPSPDRYPSDLT